MDSCPKAAVTKCHTLGGFGQNDLTALEAGRLDRGVVSGGDTAPGVNLSPATSGPEFWLREFRAETQIVKESSFRESQR